MSGGAATVEQARVCERERPRAHAHETRATAMSALQRRDHGVRRSVCRARPRRHDDRVGPIEHGERTNAVEREALVRAHLRSVGRGDHDFVGPRVHDLGSREAEDLAHDRELEGRHAVRDECGHHVRRSHRTTAPRRYSFGSHRPSVAEIMWSCTSLPLVGSAPFGGGSIHVQRALPRTRARSAFG